VARPVRACREERFLAFLLESGQGVLGSISQGPAKNRRGNGRHLFRQIQGYQSGFEGRPYNERPESIATGQFSQYINNYLLANCSIQASREEAIIWRQLKHEHVMPLIGTCEKLMSGFELLVSPWMENGDLPTFIKSIEQGGGHVDGEQFVSLV
jgi:hypothetical protein